MSSPPTPGRNSPCVCGSGKRFKHCCGALSSTSVSKPEPGVGAAEGPKRTVASNDAASKAQLGLAYLTADGVAGNPGLGIQLIDQAAALGDPQGAALAATIRATSLWHRRDLASALEFLAMAAQAGHYPSQSALQILAAGPSAVPGQSEAWESLRSEVDVQEWLSPPAFESLCDSPAIRSCDKFISVAACNWLVDQVRGRLTRSTIYDKRTGGAVIDQRRINSQSDLGVENMGVLTFIIRARIAALLKRSDGAMEIPKVLHYSIGETFAPHYDYLTPDEPAYAVELAQRGQRAATFLIYLNDDYDGGETSFTDLGLIHRGKKGGALWFDNLNGAGEPDPNTRHAGLPPTSGEKWLFSQWVRDR